MRLYIHSSMKVQMLGIFLKKNVSTLILSFTPKISSSSMWNMCYKNLLIMATRESNSELSWSNFRIMMRMVN